MEKLNVKIVDINFAHVNYSTLHHESKHIKWDRTPVQSSDKIIFYTDNMITRKIDNVKSVSWLMEPPIINNNGYNFIKSNYNNINTILTYNKDILDNVKNAIFCPHGNCWIPDSDKGLHNKTKNVSIIASAKRMVQGHQLRHDIISNINNIDVYGNGYKPIENKITGLKDYKYSITVENCKLDYYFTEKLIDCFVTGTVPIYWGCPSIGKFFDMNGIITFDSIPELKYILNNLSDEKYNSMKNAITNNYNEALKYVICEDWIYENTNLLK